MSDDRAALVGNAALPNSPQNPVTAIDIVLEPDTTMVQHAHAANDGLLKNFPKGFTLDDSHRPHISIIGGYVYTANLNKLCAAVGEVLASEKIISWKLKAFKYYYMPLKAIGLGGIVVERTAELLRLQTKLIDVLVPFMSPTGTAAAFATTPDDPDVNEATLNAVARSLSERTGEHFSPHVTIGVGTADYLDALLAQPFPAFTFSAVGATVYQFGNFGTAMKPLHPFQLTQ